MTPNARVAILVALNMIAVSVVAAVVGLGIGRNLGVNQACCAMHPMQNLRHSVREFLTLERYYSQTLQDRFILTTLYPGKKSGFFVDVGSADGTLFSNTKAFEERGWSGICVDPFPTNMDSRTCRVFREVVDSEAGRSVEFRVAGLQGGIDSYLGAWKGALASQERVTLTTVTLNDILDRAKAPRVIDYLSLDIEGAELAALQGLSFERYEVRVMTIEHNFEEPKRSQIRRLLEDRGYRLLLSLLQDDVFVHPDIKLTVFAP